MYHDDDSPVRLPTGSVAGLVCPACAGTAPYRAAASEAPCGPDNTPLLVLLWGIAAVGAIGFIKAQGGSA